MTETNFALMNNGIELCKLNDAIDALVDNVNNPNCDPLKKRGFDMKVTYIPPKKTGQVGFFQIDFVNKHAQITPSIIPCTFTQIDGGKFRINEIYSDQQYIDFDDQTPLKAIQGGK